MSEKEQIELRVIVDKKLFYNDDSMFGVYAFKPLEKEDQIKTMNDWGNFIVSGNTPELFMNREYEIIIEPSEHPKYGKGYSFVLVKQKKPTSVSEQHTYLRTMLKEKQAERIIEKYPNEKIIDLMREDEFDYSDIKGIGEKTYYKIKNYLLANLDMQEALVELNDLNISFKMMKRLIDHFGSPEVVVKKINSNIYNLTEVDGFGFKKVDEYALNRGDSKTGKNRIISATKYILEEDAKSGHSWMSYIGLKEKLLNLLQIDVNYIDNILEKLRKSNNEFYFDEDKVALKKYYNYEKQIKKKLYQLLWAENQFNINDIENRIIKAEEKFGVVYTDEQKEAIRKAVKHNVFILNGRAGTGKSLTVAGILEVLNDYQHCCCALSGKASNILSEKGLNSMTIHRMLGFNPRGGFKYNSKKPLPYPIVVLDESSMCSSQMMFSIINAIQKGGKIIFVGDNGQLSPIGCGSVFEDLLNANKFPQQELTKIHRQAQKSGILKKANEVRDGKQITERYNYSKQVYGELKDFVTIPVQKRDNIQEMILDICRNFKKNVYDFQVIVGNKSKGDISVVKLNNEIQKIFNKNGGNTIKRGKYTYKIGDKIIHNGNNYEAGENGEQEIFNGTLGKIVNIELGDEERETHDKIYIDFDGVEETIVYEKDELDKIELAYAITNHRSQGSTIPYVLFAFDFTSYLLLSRQFVYTGITRSSKGCVMICENKALHHAIRTDHSGLRRTFLYDLLVKEDNK